MSQIPDAIDLVRRAIAKGGAAELARRSGVPYTTIRDWQGQDFQIRSVDALDKLATASEAYLADHPENEAAA